MNTACNRKSNRAVEECTFWVDGIVHTEKDPLVKKKIKKGKTATCQLQVITWVKKKSPVTPHGPSE